MVNNTKKTMIAFAIIALPLATMAQKGIAFQQELNWNQIIEKAKTTNKYIFIDCYASWCGPCKKMDSEVYTNDTIGTYFNNNFISVKYQLDTARSDDSNIKARYSDAHQINYHYKVNAYPTFLFLSPDGKLVHRGIGYLSTKAFLDLAKEAVDPSMQYYTLQRQFEDGKMSYAQMPALMTQAHLFGDDVLTNKIGLSYIHEYLEPLPEKEFLRKENIRFMIANPKLLTSHDRLIQLALKNPWKIDDTTVTYSGFSKALVSAVIYREVFQTALNDAKLTKVEPNWNKIASDVSLKFGTEYVEGNENNAKEAYYRDVKQWDKYTDYFVKNRIGLENAADNGWNSMVINNCAFEVFQHTGNLKKLAVALKWVNSRLITKSKHDELYGGMLDTKAGILLRMGQRSDALDVQEEAVRLAPKNKQMADNLKKIKANVPTWQNEGK